MKYKVFSIQNQGGQAMLLSVVLSLMVALALVAGLSGPVLSDTVTIRTLYDSSQSYAAAESLVEDVTYRILNAESYSATEELSVGAASSSISIAPNGTEHILISSATSSRAVRRIDTRVGETITIPFIFGAQAGNGGIILENTASVSGDVYANGPIVGGAPNVMEGNVISATALGRIDGVDIRKDAKAHEIRNAIVLKDAYYQTISNTVVHGNRYSTSTDQPALALPITDATIEQWKTLAAAGGTHSTPCPYEITTIAALGPKKINCNLHIKNFAAITLNGPVWVVGDLIVENNSTVTLGVAAGGKSVPIVVDNPSNRTTGSTAQIQNSAVFAGNPLGTTAVLIVSQNNSAENGGSVKAIEVENSTSGDLVVFAGHGEVNLKNNVSLKEIAAYVLRLSNSSSVSYLGALSSLVLQYTTPSVNDWKEIE